MRHTFWLVALLCAGCAHTRESAPVVTRAVDNFPPSPGYRSGWGLGIGLRVHSRDGAVLAAGGQDSLHARFEYPEIARRAGVEGGTHAAAVVGSDGVVRRAWVTSTDNDLFDPPLLRAVRATRFALVPAVAEGDSAEVEVSAYFRIFSYPTPQRQHATRASGAAQGALKAP